MVEKNTTPPKVNYFSYNSDSIEQWPALLVDIPAQEIKCGRTWQYMVNLKIRIFFQDFDL